MMSDRVKLSKQDNKQLGRKTFRFLHINSRFFVLFSLFLTTFVLVTLLNGKLQRQSLHHYVKGFFYSRHRIDLNASKDRNDEDIIESDDPSFDLIWNEETVALLQDQLGIIEDSSSAAEQCNLDERQIIATALPGPNNENMYEAVWQFLSLFALQSQTISVDDYGREFTLKAFVTEQMRIMLDQLFEGDLPLEMISHLPTTCYNLRYSKIIGNTSPINLKELMATNAPLLLNPTAKRTQEITKLFDPQTRPLLKFKQEIMNEVDQEFLVTRTLQEMEFEKTDNMNFVGMYLSADDKLPLEYYQRAMDSFRKNDKRHQIFMVVCDVETLTYCKESFDGESAVGDVRVLRKSSDTFDLVLLANCNATIVSNEMGAIHAILNGGPTTVHYPPDSDKLYYVPWLLSEQMSNWNALRLEA